MLDVEVKSNTVSGEKGTWDWRDETEESEEPGDQDLVV